MRKTYLSFPFGARTSTKISLVGLIAVLGLLLGFFPTQATAQAETEIAVEEKGFCNGDCRIQIFTGDWVEDGQVDVLLLDPKPPWDWDYFENENIYGLAFSKRLWTLWNVIHIEPEVGLAYRTGAEEAYEVWGVFYFRFEDFPWKNKLYTSVGISTGFSYASSVTELERRRARGSETGSKFLHYLSPEISFALPKYQQYELVFRMHHRSGGYGTINDTYGGAQYGTIGLRVSF